MTILRYTHDDDGIDELVARRSAVHLERLNEHDWMLVVSCGNQRVHLTVQNVTEFETENVSKVRK